MTKDNVLAFDEKQAKVDRQPCPHANVIHHIEPDGDIVICSDCGGWLDEDGNVYRYSPSLEETF